MNRKAIVIALASFSALAAPAFAEPFGDRARVVSVHPVLERIPVSREECWNDHVRSYEDRQVTRTDTGASIGPGTVLGAVVGGVLGHQVGNGRGNTAATIAGAAVGGLAGNQYDRSNGAPPVQTTEVERVPVERNVERCRTVQEVREATVGYDVRYDYNGRQFTTRLPNDPGRFIHVRVDVQPVVEEAAPPPPRVSGGPRPPSYR
ncbi:MAG TPA: glycine zipper 2TM domain-containing protein [Usitatibacter sp.]|nr:glycine zipper 2TM domain-containing protein [Usitatibacter sp.]